MRTRAAGVLGGLCIGLAGRSADAAEARYTLEIGPKSYADALIDLGFQANVSVLGTSACGPGGRVNLSGAFTLEEALHRLTFDAPCTYRIVDPRTVRITAVSIPLVTAPSRPPTLVAELLVTALKRPAGVNQLPASISVIPHDQIELTGTADVGDTTGQLSGVLTTNLGPGRNKLILRGLSDGAFTGHARSTVGSYLDDAPINYNAPDPDLRLVDVERVEVVRGPQGALYGSGSLTGVYRIVTRRPDVGRWEGGAAALGAATEGGAPSWEAEGYLNAPIAPGRAAIRLVGYGEVQGGYIDNPRLSLRNGDRTSRDGGRFALRLQPLDEWQLDLTAISQRLRSNDSHYTKLDPRLGRVQERHKNDFDEVNATVRGELGWASLRSSLVLIDHTFSSQYDASAVTPSFDVDPASLGIYLEKTHVGMLVEDTVLRSARPGRLAWLAGVYGAATLEKSPSSLDIHKPVGGLARVYEEHRRDRLREIAAYGEASYEFAPRWTVSAGARLFNNEVRTRALVLVDLPGASRSFEGARRFSGVSPKISLQREFDDGGLAYVLFSEGYRPGGFNTGGFLFPIRPSRVSFGPDRLRNYEAGIKASLIDHRMPLRLTVFHDRWSHIQSDQYRPSGLPFTVNVGDARITGLETEVGYDWDFGLSVQASALFLRSRLVNPNLDFAHRLTDRLPGVPNTSGGLLAVYQHPLPRDMTLRVTFETSYVGPAVLSFDANAPTSMGDYSKTKLAAEVASRSWSAMVFMTNPANDSGDTFAYGNPFTFGLVRQSTPQRPRTIGLRLAATY